MQIPEGFDDSIDTSAAPTAETGSHNNITTSRTKTPRFPGQRNFREGIFLLGKIASQTTISTRITAKGTSRTSVSKPILSVIKPDTKNNLH